MGLPFISQPIRDIRRRWLWSLFFRWNMLLVVFGGPRKKCLVDFIEYIIVGHTSCVVCWFTYNLAMQWLFTICRKHIKIGRTGKKERCVHAIWTKVGMPKLIILSWTNTHLWVVCGHMQIQKENMRLKDTWLSARDMLIIIGLNNQRSQGDLYDHLMSTRISNLMMNKTFIRGP